VNRLLERYKYLWTTEKDNYLLNDRGSSYYIERKDGKRRIAIEDEEIEIYVIVKMIENGCEIIKKY